MPAGSWFYYRKKSEESSEDISLGSRDWGNLIGHGIGEIIEVGVDEEDVTQFLYETIQDYTDYCKHLQDSISRMSEFAYDSILYSLHATEGGEISAIEAKIHDYFEWVEKKVDWGDNNELVPMIPELYSMVNDIATNLSKAEKDLDDLSDQRWEYYRIKREYENALEEAEETRIKAENAQKEAEKTQDEDKKKQAEDLMGYYEYLKVNAEFLKREVDQKASELYSKINEVRDLVFSNSCGTLLSYILHSDILMEKFYAFLNTIESEIAAVPTIITDASRHANQWYSLSGQHLPQKPTKTGLYIRDGRKVIVK